MTLTVGSLFSGIGGIDLGLERAVCKSDTSPLKPFFSYYGGKWRLAPKYPLPRYGTIIEPFAGAAGYSTRFPDRNVILIDKDPRSNLDRGQTMTAVTRAQVAEFVGRCIVEHARGLKEKP